MKKFSILAVVAIFTIGLTSCKKDYTCTCTYPTGSNESVTYKDVKKADAEDACSALSSLAAIGGGSCSID